MQQHLRIARLASDLERAVRMYSYGLSLEQIASFEDHQGFDGVMLGEPNGHFHLELTYCRHHPVNPNPTPEDLLVFYVPEQQDWSRRCERLYEAGLSEVPPFNPYWAQLGCAFQDLDGYRLAIQRPAWSNKAKPYSA
jgi:catechol 2,3-dioxygenase-like lactoylglutathione lyase family enzyme